MTSWTYAVMKTREPVMEECETPAPASVSAAERPLAMDHFGASGRWRSKGVSGSVGAILTIGIHVVVLAALLASRTAVQTEPAPINVAVISDAPQQQERELEITQKPQLERPRLHVPQPEVTLADDAAPVSAPVAVSSAPPQQAEPAEPAVTMPVFDADYLNNPAPAYPHLSRRLREQGVVYVRVRVSPEGLPDQVELKRSSGSQRLDEAALSTVKKWRFVPARRGSTSVFAWVVVPIAFSLTTA